MSCDHGVGGEWFVLDVTINLVVPGGWLFASTAFGVLGEILDRLDHDGIRPYRTSIEVTQTPTH